MVNLEKLHLFTHSLNILASISHSLKVCYLTQHGRFEVKLYFSGRTMSSVAARTLKSSGTTKALCMSSTFVV